MTFKKINKNPTKFYVFENVVTGKYLIHDEKFDEPIYYGSYNMVEGIIKNIKLYNSKSSIYYYIINKNGPIKLDPSFSYNV